MEAESMSIWFVDEEGWQWSASKVDNGVLSTNSTHPTA